MYTAEFSLAKYGSGHFTATSMSLLLLRLMRFEAIMFEAKLWFVHLFSFSPLTLVGLRDEDLFAKGECTIHLCNTQSVSHDLLHV